MFVYSPAKDNNQQPMQTSIRTILLVLLCSVAVASAQNLAPNEAIPLDPKITTGKLSNGIKYFIRKNGRPEKRVEMRLVVNTGSVLEDEDQQGLAHFAEHMAFNGTKKYPKQELINFLESNGVKFGPHLNAYTSFDETVYMLQLPTDKPNNLEIGIDVLSEWAQHIAFDSVEVEKERGVVIEEWRLGRGAEDRIWMKEAPYVFYGSRYAERMPIGKKEILEGFSHESIKRFYRDWYRPDLMSVIVVGDCDPADVERIIKQEFGELRNPPSPRPRVEHELKPHEELFVLINTDKELSWPMFESGYKRVERKTRTVGDIRRNMQDMLYDGMFNMRLQELTKKGDPPFVFGFGGEYNFFGNSRMYTVNAMLKSDNVLQGAEAVLREAYRARQHGFTQSEFERQKKQMMNDLEKRYLERDKTESSQIARELVSHVTDEVPVAGVEYMLEVFKNYLEGITLSEVNALSAERFTKHNRIITFSAPEKEGVVVPTKEELLALVNKLEGEQHAAYDDGITNKVLFTALPEPKKIVSEKSDAVLGITAYELPNGSRVIVKSTDFKDDEVLLSATSPGGLSLVSDAESKKLWLAAQLVDESGLADIDPIQLQKILAGKTVSVLPYVRELEEGFTGESSKKDLETMFQMLNLAFTAPRKDAEAAGAYIARWKSFEKNQETAPLTAFYDTLQVTVSNYHPRRKPITAASYDAADLEKSYEFYKDRFADVSDFTFFIVGSVTANEIRPLIERYIATLPGTGRKEAWRDIGVTKPSGAIKKAVYAGVDDKSQVNLQFHGKFDWSVEDRHTLQALTQAFQIKLREVLREDKGGVYGVGVWSNTMKHPKGEYAISIGFGCAPDRVEELTNEVMRQIDTLGMRPMAQSYVDKVRELQRKEYETNLRENKYWLSQLVSYHTNGDDPNQILRAKERIDTITAKTLHEAAQRYFQPSSYVQVVQYPKK